MPSHDSTLPTIGFLGACNPEMWGKWVAAFEEQLGTRGWTQGSTINIEYRWAEGLEKNYAKYAKEFVRDKVKVIVTGGTQSTFACKKAAAAVRPAIPVVFATAGNPVDTKLVATFSQPGNVTGLSNQQINLVIKRLDYLRQLVGKARGQTPVGLIGNDKSPNVKLEMKIAQQVAPSLGLKVRKGSIRKQKDIARVIGNLKGKVKGLLVCTDPLITTHAQELNDEASRANLPTVHAFREYLDHGGCVSYGPHFADLFKKAADIVDVILRGQAGEDMINVPVQQPDNFEGCIHKGPFRKMGLAVPASLLALADHVME
jgi:putative tryptophan/tyrosine transport system substrate-binding protein